MNPKVSIIIPCYGVEKYLDRCMNTIVNQTLKEIEIILVDDGSPDRVPEMCDEWKLKDERIKVIHKKNAGLGYARNSGLEIATGEYVAFVDSDDFVELGMFSRLVETSEEGFYDAVFCGLKKQLDSGENRLVHDFSNVTTFSKSQMDLLSLSFLLKTELIQNERLLMSVWHGIYKRSLIEDLKLRFYSEREILSEDLPFQVVFVKNCSKIKFIPDFLYSYCYNNNSLTHKFNTSKFDSAIRLKDLLYSIVPVLDDAISFVDAEFYGRIRHLLKSFVLSENFTFKEKYLFIKTLCSKNEWGNLSLKLIAGRSWKYLFQYRLLVGNRPFLLFLFVHFDEFVNKGRALSFIHKTWR